jgi:phage-related minor tail protein
MDDREQVALETEHDALAHPASALQAEASKLGGRNAHAAQQERVLHGQPRQWATREQRGDALDVDDDIGELRHRARLQLLFSARNVFVEGLALGRRARAQRPQSPRIHGKEREPV